MPRLTNVLGTIAVVAALTISNSASALSCTSTVEYVGVFAPYSPSRSVFELESTGNYSAGGFVIGNYNANNVAIVARVVQFGLSYFPASGKWTLDSPTGCIGTFVGFSY